MKKGTNRGNESIQKYIPDQIAKVKFEHVWKYKKKHKGKLSEVIGPQKEATDRSETTVCRTASLKATSRQQGAPSKVLNEIDAESVKHVIVSISKRREVRNGWGFSV